MGLYAVAVVDMFRFRVETTNIKNVTSISFGLSDNKDESKQVCYEVNSPEEAHKAKGMLLQKGYLLDASQETNNSVWISFEIK